MKSAAPKTYISKRMLSQYQERRALKAQAKSKASQPPKKQFEEDKMEEEKKEEQPVVQQISMSQAAQQVQPSMASQEQPQKKQGLFSRIAGSFSFGGGGAAKNQEKAQALEVDRNLSCEEMDSDDLGGDLNLSDQEDGMARRGVWKSHKQSKRATTNQVAEVYRQEFDTNVFEIALDILADKGQLATGDAEICSCCQAVFNQSSVLKEVDGNQIWKCEFCNHDNEVMIEAEEIPQAPAVTYLLEAPAQVQDAKAGGNAASDISVIFCMDISGSMCVTQPVAGKHKLRGDNLAALQAQMKQFGDGSDQFMSAQDRGMTYVSRIQCVKSAIDSQINDMNNGAAERKIGIVTFNHEVQVIGDGTQAVKTITGDHLQNFEYMQNNGKALAASMMTQSVGETKDVLKTKLDQIEETGPTALGPGILTAVAMAAEGSAGSTVVICTDGLANIGLGAWDECHTEADINAAQQFYERIGQIASTAGVTINIVSIEGDECNLESLSSLAELTGGSVERVNPTNLTKDFANMLQLPVLATNVEAKVKLHKGLQFRNELATDLSEDKSLLARRFGNTTAETVFTFEYGMKPISQLLEMEDIDMGAITSFPFQAMIKYTALDGSKCLRVITKNMEVSQEREELSQNVNASLLQKNCIQRGTNMARAGNIRQAQAIMKGFKRQAAKQMAPQMQQVVMADFSEQVQDVYRDIGNAVDSEGEEELDQMIGESRGGGGGGGGGEMMQASMMMRGAAMESEESMFAPKSKSMNSAAPRKKVTSQVAGGKKRMNDAVSTKLYKLSKK